jgi:tetratricopeptide (TPR) repeat protein
MFDAFISHAAEDKEALVCPLAEKLTDAGYKIWCDEFQRQIGDSLGDSIDRGLADSRFGIVILSPSFFAKQWPQHELDALVSKEMEGGKVVLPIWHGVSKADIVGYSPSLADKLALDTVTHTIDEIVALLADVLGTDDIPSEGEARDQAALFDVRKRVVKAFVNKGVALGQLGKSEEEIALYDEIDRRYAQDALPGVREQVVWALVNKGVTLGELGKSEAEIAVYDEIDRRYGQDDLPSVREQVAKALVNKGVTLAQQDKNEAAIAVFDDIDNRYGQDASPGVRKQVASALVNKGVILGQLNKYEAVMAVCDEIDRRYGQDASPGVCEQVAKALGAKGMILGQLGQHEAAVAALDELERRYGSK